MRRRRFRAAPALLPWALAALCACEGSEARRQVGDEREPPLEEEGETPDAPDAETDAEPGLEREETSRCGNHHLDPGEACETGETRSCVLLGYVFVGGTATCAEDCSRFVLRSCVSDGSELCGNEVEEGLETCDADVVPCVTLGSAFTGGEAPCRADCKTYDVSACETAMPPYGVLDGRFVSGFVLDDARLGDAAYIGAHPEGVQREPAFMGTYGPDARTAPHAGADRTVAYALRNQRREWLYVLQDSYGPDGSGGSAYLGPRFELHFTGPDIGVGRYTPNMHVMGATRLYQWDFDAAGDMVCLRAIGVGGTLEVTRADGLAAADGGAIEFEVRGVRLFHVRSSPYGQQTLDTFKDVALCPLD